MSALLLAAPAFAQQDTQNVEVEPVSCWWRTSATQVRIGQPFTLVLTCSILETEAARAIVDRSRLASSAVQLPPFEIIGGTQSEDVVTAGRRFFQYEYQLRLIGEDMFGRDVAIPKLEVPYRIESKVQQDAVQGRDQTYEMPITAVHVASLVPADAVHIRESPIPTFAQIASREFRGSMMRTVGGVLYGLAALMVLVAIVRAVTTKRRAAGIVREATLSNAAILQGARRELESVRDAARGGWTEDLVARGLAALRIVGSYAADQPVARRRSSDPAVGGQLVMGGRWPGSNWIVSGASTAGIVSRLASSGNDDIQSALESFTAARYGRESEKARDLDDAIETGLRAARRVAAKHTWAVETMRAMRSTGFGLRGARVGR